MEWLDHLLMKTDTPQADADYEKQHAAYEKWREAGWPAFGFDNSLCQRFERENNRYAELLHDGFAVYSALTEEAKRYTTPENVSAVLDAFKRALSNK